MTEQEWLTSEDPYFILKWLIDNRPPSDRKLRLFSDACRHSFFHGYLIRDNSWSGFESLSHQKSRSRDESSPASQASLCWAAEMAIYEIPIRVNYLRDIFGNPFHSPEPFTIQHSTIKDLAQAAWDLLKSDLTIEPARLFILSDALEEAGCSDEQVLWHLRGICAVCEGQGCHRHPPVGFRDCSFCEGTGHNNTSHVRGCYVIDLIIGNK